MKTWTVSLLCLAVLAWPCALEAKPKKGQGKQQQQQGAARQDPSELLSKFIEAHLGAILAPLGKPAMDNPEGIIDLEEHLGDQMTKAPDTMAPAYKAAMQVCDAMASAVDARGTAAGNRQGSAAVTATAGLGATHGWTDSKSWWTDMEKERQQLRREHQEQQKVSANQKKTDAFFKSGEQAEWMKQAAQWRQQINGLYANEREVERQCKLATETADSQKRATEKYPDLGVSGSALNQEFVSRYQAMKAASDPTLSNPDWPEAVAKAAADAVSKAGK